MAITPIKIDELLAPVSKDNPVGKDVFNDLFLLKDMIAGKPRSSVSPAVPPDWKNGYRTAQKLLLQGKDLWAANCLAYASLELYEFEGFIKALDLMKQLLEQYWDNITPHLDPDDEDDPAMARLNPISTLCALSEYPCRKIKTMPLVKTKRIGNFTYEELKILGGGPGEKDERLKRVKLEHIYSEIQGEHFDRLLGYFNKCIELLTDINDFVTEKVGEQNNTCKVEPLVNLLNEIMLFFEEDLAEELQEEETQDILPAKTATTETTPSPAKATTPKPTPTVSTPQPKASPAPKPVETKAPPVTMQSGDLIISSEKEAKQILVKVEKWYRANVPTSPVASIVSNAIGVIGRDFLEILQGLTGNPDTMLKLSMDSGIETKSVAPKAPAESSTSQKPANQPVNKMSDIMSQRMVAGKKVNDSVPEQSMP